MKARGGMLLVPALVERACREPGTRLGLRRGDGSERAAVITRRPLEGT